jgi:Probable Zinc-ribbon domain
VASQNAVNPTEVQPGSPTSYWWICNKDHAFKASPVNRTRGGTGCPSCANSGFDPTEKGYLYLLRKEFQGLQQFGITNIPDRRLRTHKANGWELLDVIGPADGYWISDTERLLKKYFRSLGLLLPRSFPDKFDGYSESWKATEKTYVQLSELLSDLRGWEESCI